MPETSNFVYEGWSPSRGTKFSIMNKVKHAYTKGYRINKKGEIINPKGDVINGYTETYKGYSRTKLSLRGLDGKQLKVGAHRLQAYQKFGDDVFEKGIQVRHLDGNSLNNSWDNIAIGTQSDNMMDVPEHIRKLRASQAGKKHDHDKIIEMHKSGFSYSSIMKELGISSAGTISFIVKNSMAASK